MLDASILYTYITILVIHTTFEIKKNKLICQLFNFIFLIIYLSPSLSLYFNNAKSQHKLKWSDGNWGAGKAKSLAKVFSISSLVYVSNTAMGTNLSAVNQM